LDLRSSKKDKPVFWIYATKITKRSIAAIIFATAAKLMGSAGFEPAASSAQGWHHTKLDNDPSLSLMKAFPVGVQF
jgi:hypothetical protein